MSNYEFSDAQLRVLSTVGDAALQAFTGSEAEEIVAAIPASFSEEQRALARKLAGTKFSDLPGALNQVIKHLKIALSPPNLRHFGRGLSLLSTRAGSLLLTGHAKPFPDLTIPEREAVLKKWSVSSLAMFRNLFRGSVAVQLYIAYNNFTDVALATGFPALGDPHRGEDVARVRSSYVYKFENASTPYQYFETDVLIVGSGAGGGVVASELAEKGWKVFVVEKGVYQKTEEFPGTPKAAFSELYEGRGLMATEDASVSVLAGATFGGGTTVNWSASLRPQHFVRQQWAQEHDLPYFLSKNFADSIDTVCERMQVSDKHIKHNKPNQKLIEASVKLGYPCTTIPQNTGGAQHWCGHCGFGCVYGEKQSGPVLWLRRAAENDAQFMVETRVERLLFAKDRTSAAPTADSLNKFWPTLSRRLCVGALVKDLKTGQFGIVRAKQAVVVSAGSINSPVVLMRSGLQSHRIGKNLRLHPATCVTGTYDEDINPWEGGIMTAVSSVQENWDGTHHGVKLEVIQSFPGGRAATTHPWRGALDHKKAQVQFGKTFAIIAIARDRGSGSIFVDANGAARIDYKLDPYDRQSLLRGIIAAAEIHLISGATRITSPQIAVEDYYPAPGHQFMTDPNWFEWIAEVEKVGVKPGACGIGSAHQMGSNQMGSKPTTSVVDPRARVWGCDCLYIADASIFPTASGVNPLLTNLSLSHSVAQFIDEDLRNAAVQPVQAHL